MKKPSLMNPGNMMIVNRYVSAFAFPQKERCTVIKESMHDGLLWKNIFCL